MSDPPEPVKPPEEDDREEAAEEEDEQEDEDEEEEEEPQLKYERITGDIAKVVRGDLVSSFCVGSKVIVCLLPCSLWRSAEEEQQLICVC